MVLVLELMRSAKADSERKTIEKDGKQDAHF